MIAAGEVAGRMCRMLMHVRDSPRGHNWMLAPIHFNTIAFLRSLINDSLLVAQ